MRMKTVYTYLTLALIAVFIISCSESEDLTSGELLSETRASSPLLIASPTEVYFNETTLYGTTNDTINIKTAGLSSLSALTNLDITLQGADALNFEFTRPQLSLSQLLQALLGNGIDIPVAYNPIEYGSHEAELLVTASLLEVLMPIQTTIPLHGSTIDAPIPHLVRSIPENGGTVTFEAKVPGSETLEKGQYHLDFIFDRDIQVVDALGIALTQPTSAVIYNMEVVNGNTLRVTIHEDELTIVNELIIDANSIVSAGLFPSSSGNERIVFHYKAVGEIPDNEI